jgi:phospholipase C
MFEGEASNTARIAFHCDPQGSGVLTVDYGGAFSQAYTVADAKSGRVHQHNLRPTDRLTRRFDFAGSGRWYDLTVSGPGVRHRFVGRAENGKAGMTDPVMTGLT